MKPNNPALEADTTPAAAPTELDGSGPEPEVEEGTTTPPVPVPRFVEVAFWAMAVAGWVVEEVVLGAMEEDEVRVMVLTWETWMVRVMVEVEVVVAMVVSCARARRGRAARRRVVNCILMVGFGGWLCGGGV